MTTEFAPPTIPSVETGTPPREWSDSVLASSPVRDTPATFPETPARPYNPEKKLEEQSQASKPLKAQEVSHPLPSKEREGLHVSLPSTELKGAQPSEHTGGVGALPGNLSESSVALLPDERKERTEELSPASPRQRRDTIKPSGAAGVDEQTKESKTESQTKIPRDAPPPKSEQAASKSSSVPLQGKKKGAEEAGQHDVVATGPPVGSQEETRDIESQHALDEQRRADSDVEGSSKADQVQSATRDVQGREREQKDETAEKVQGGYGGDYHPAVLHPPPPGASAAEYQSPAATEQEAQDVSTTETSHQSTKAAEKKHGFMTMVKGILAGK